MSVFHGDWNEDPNEFLNLYLQCTAGGGDKFRARQFVNYLGAGSDADEWYDELPQEERKDWAAIEYSFRKRWLKEEVLGIKEIATIENDSNEPQVSPHSPKIIQNQVFIPQKPSDTPTMFPTMSSTSTKAKTTVAMSQSPAPFKDEKNSKSGSTSEISSNTIEFSSPTPSATVFNILELPTTFTAHETRSKAASFAKKCEKIENPSIFFEKPPETRSPTIFEHGNDSTRVYTSLRASNNAVLLPPTLIKTATSSQPQPSTGHQKCEPLCVTFKYPLSISSSVPTGIVTALKTRSETAGFMKIHQKIANSPILTKIAPESLVSSHSKQTDDIYLLLLSTTIVTAPETHSTTADFMKIHQKIENSPIFTKIAPEPLVSDRLLTYFLLPPSIAPTIHPCNLSSLLVMILFCLSIVISQHFRDFPQFFLIGCFILVIV
jgi:hypothetical protein